MILTQRTDDSVDTAVAGTSMKDDTVWVTDARLNEKSIIKSINTTRNHTILPNTRSGHSSFYCVISGETS